MAYNLSNICYDPNLRKAATYIDGCLVVSIGSKIENELCCQKSINYPVDSSRSISEFIPPRTILSNVYYPSSYVLFDNKLNDIPNLPRLQTRGFQMCIDHSSAPSTITDENLNVYLRITTADGNVTSVPVFNQFTWFGNPTTENKKFILDKVEVVNDNDYCINIKALLLLCANTGAMADGLCPFENPTTSSITNNTTVIPVSLKTPILAATTLSDTAISLTIGQVYNAQSYAIYYSATGLDDSFSLLTAVTSLTYTDSTLTPNTTRYYRVVAIGDGVNFSDSKASLIVSATTLLPKIVAPVLTVIAVDNTSIRLDWNNVANEYYYQIQHSTDNVNFSDMASTVLDVTTYLHTGLIDGSLHYYRVMAVADPNLATDSDYSNVGSATTFIKLSVPSNFTGIAISDTQIDLSWSSVSNSFGYNILSSLDGINYTTIATINNESTTSYSAINLTEFTDYYFRIYAVGSGTVYQDSNQSSFIKVTTLQNTSNNITFNGETVTFNGDPITFNDPITSNVYYDGNGFIQDGELFVIG